MLFMMRNLLFILFFFQIVGAYSQWQSELIEVDSNGKLVYHQDEFGFVLPDFSYAGYDYGQSALPDYPVKKEISPIFGDNTAHIQAAIDEVEALEPDENGIRGAVLLHAGIYEVSGSLFVSESGVVLRGVGDDEDEESNTIISAVGDEPHQRTVLQLGYEGSYEWDDNTSNFKQFITNDTVPIGSKEITIESTVDYGVGDYLVIYHPCSSNWLEKVKYGETGNDPGWSVNELPIMFYRQVVAISGNILELNAPVYYPLIKEISQCYIFKPDTEKVKYNMGVENLRIEIQSEGGEDENHAWDGIRFKNAENCWAKDCTVKGFGQGGLITQYTTQTTIENCKAIDPVAIVTGERMYNFNFYLGSQLILVKDCYARNGRHHYISNGTTTVSGCVVYNCVSDAIYSATEGHRKWSTGLLFDNLQEINLRSSGRLVFALYNRGDKGTAHGWSAAHCVAWNCDFDDARACIQQPPGAQNYAIGCAAKRINGDEVDFPHDLGYVEGTNQSGLFPGSLYEAQWKDRNGIPIGINEKLAMGTVKIFPNPVGDKFKITGLGNRKINRVQIYGINGAIKFQKKYVQVHNELLINCNLESGLYLINIDTESGNIVKKLVVR